MTIALLFVLLEGSQRDIFSIQDTPQAEAAGATATWDGGGADNNATTAANWSGDTLPTAGDNIVFDATSTKAVTWNISAATTFATFTMSSAYTSTMTLNTSLNTGAFTMNGGTITFNASSISITTSGDMIIGDGSHVATINSTANSSAETYKVVLNVTGNITVATSSTIIVDGKGYSGTNGTGKGASVGEGGGGGHGGDGGTGSNSGTGGTGYGSVSAPTNIGSPGGNSGGEGGGAIQATASGTITVSGIVSANGNAAPSNGKGGGSGGSVYLTATTLTGSGTIRANGGTGGGAGCCNNGAGGGGGGRIALYYTSNTFNGTNTAYGGTRGGSNGTHGGAGTIYLKAVAATNGDLLIDNNSNAGMYTRILSTRGFDNLTIKNAASYLIPNSVTCSVATAFTNGTSTGSITINSGGVLVLPPAGLSGAPGTINNAGTVNSSSTLTVTSGVTLNHQSGASLPDMTALTLSGGTFVQTGNIGSSNSISGAITVTSGTYTINHANTITTTGLTVSNTGTINSSANSSAESYKVNITVNGNADIQSGGAINVDGKGYSGTNGTGKGVSAGEGGGGAYGGDGGLGTNSGTGGTGYGSITAPTNIGSPGGNSGGAGGGAIQLTVSGTLTVAGTLSSNGNAAPGNGTGGGSGGSVYLNAATITGGGTIRANGGTGGGAGCCNNGAGGGGGGRIAVYYTTNTFSGTTSAYSGARGSVNAYPGGAGTVYLKSAAATYGDLVLDSNSPSGTAAAARQLTSATFSNLTIKNGAQYLIPSGSTTTITTALTNGTSTAAITVNSGGILDISACTLSGGPGTINNAGTINTASTFAIPSGVTFNHNSGAALPNVATLTDSGTFVWTGGTTASLANMTVGGTFTFNTGSTLSLTTLTVPSGGLINSSANSSAETYKVNITVSGNADIQSGGSINVDGKGFTTGNGTGKGTNPGGQQGGGGGYGGDGGTGTNTGTGGAGYGSITAPTSIGSPGGGPGSPGSGGGAIRLTVAGTLTVNGTLTANGNNGPTDNGGGSGGSIYLDATSGTITGGGTIRANGGSGGGSGCCNWGAGGGGGGRVALYYTTNTFSGTNSAYSGARGSVNATPGGAGTIYLKSTAATNGDLVMNANSPSGTAASTRINGTFQDISTLNGAIALIVTSNLTASRNVSIGSGTTLNASSLTFTVGGNFANSGTFTAGTSTVVFDTAGTAATVSGSNTFNNLTCITAGKSITFTAGTTQTISGALTLTGSAGSYVTLRSSSNGSYWNIAPNGTRSVSYADVKDSNNTTVTAISPTNSVDSGGNVNWFTNTIAGTAYSDQGVSALGAGITIKFDVNGVERGTTTTAANGTFSLSVSYSNGDSVIGYISGNASKGTTATVVAGSAISGFDIYGGNTVIARHETGSSITNSNFSTAKGALADTDILYSVSAGNLSLAASTKFYIASGKTFAPGGNVTFTSTFTNKGTLSLAGSETLTGFTNDTTQGTTDYTGNGTFTSLAGGNSYYHLTISGTGSFRPSSTLTVNGNLTISNASGSLDMNGQNLTLGGGSAFSNSGTLKLAGSETFTNFTNDATHGTIMYTGSGSYATLAAGYTYNNLTMNGSGTFTLAGDPAIRGNLTYLTPTGAFNGYAKYKVITIDHTKVGASLTNYPMLFSVTDADLRTVANGGSVTNANGYDIVFYDGNTKLDHQVETYVASTGQLIAWVRIPTLSNTVDTTIRIYFNNSNISTSQEAATSVWDTQFKGVWHFPNGSSLSALDSTAMANNGSISGATAAAGKVDGAASFNGNTISVANNSSLNYGSAFTIGAWIKTTTTGWRWLVTKNGGSWLGINGAGNLTWTRAAGFDYVSSRNVIDNNWNYVVVTFNSGSLNLYVNGSNVGSWSGVTLATTTGTEYFGQRGDNVEYYIGSMDEVRLSNTALSTGWLTTDYNNINSPSTFTSVGATQTLPPVTPAVIAQAGHTITIGGNFVNTAGGTLTGSGTVAFNDAAQTSTISGSTTFYNLSSTTAGKAITFTDGTTQTITNAITLNGGSGEGNKIVLRSSNPGSYWYINPSGTRSVSYVDVQDSTNNNVTAITASHTVDSGHNVNWTTTADTVSVPTITNYNDGSWISGNTPGLQFNMTDPNANEVVKYHIQIDNSADFGSPEVDFTESNGLSAPRVGVTYAPSALADGSYYWRVQIINAANSTGSYATANSGAVAFKVDTAAPTPGTFNINGGATYTTSPSATLTIAASDGGSGLSQMMVSQAADFSGASWESYATSKAWTLTGGQGTNTVYIRYKDVAGNISTSSQSAIMLDSVNPTGSVIINAGDSSTSSRNTTLTISASDATSGLYQMEISEDSGFSGASWETYATTKAFTLSVGDATKTVYIRFKDNAGNVSLATSDDIVLDTAAPTSGSVSINSAATYATSRNVTLTISALDSTSGVYQMQVSEDPAFAGASWEAYAPSKAFTLAATDGTRTVYVRFVDNAGNISGSTSDSIILDRSGPIATDFNINSDAAYTTSGNVTLTIGAIDLTTSVQDMMISENSLFTGAVWESYATSSSLALSAGDGVKTVYIKFRDPAGNTSLPTFDTITLDTTMPDGSVAINSGDGYTQTDAVTLTLAASDNLGVSEMRVSEDPSFTGVSWEAYATTKAFTLSVGDGTKSVYAEFRDDAGNVSGTVNDAITYDTAVPVSNSIVINSGDANTATTSVVLTLSSTDATSGVDQMMLSENATFIGASWEAYATTRSFTLSSGDGTKTVYAKFKDNAGNVSSNVSDSIVQDTTAPVPGYIKINNGAAYTSSTSINLKIAASDATTSVSSMMISPSATFLLASWQAFTTDTTYTLASGDGAKTLYIKFKDSEGNTSTPIYSNIILDTTAPTGSVSINSGAATTSSLGVTLTISGNDTGSGIASMQVSDDPTFAGETSVAYVASKSFTFSGTDGTKTIYVRFTDAIGNVSATYSDAITYKTPKSQSDTGSGSTSGGSGSGSGESSGGDTTGGGSGSGSSQGNGAGQNGGTSNGGSGSGTNGTNKVAEVQIKIVDSSNNPIPNAKVTLEDGTVAYTNSEGVVVFENIAEGQKNLKVEYNNKVEEKQITVSKDSSTVSVKVSWSIAKGIEIAKTALLVWAGIMVVGAMSMLVIKRLRRKTK